MDEIKYFIENYPTFGPIIIGALGVSSGFLVGLTTYFASSKIGSVIRYYRFKKNNKNVKIINFPTNVLEKIDEFDEEALMEEYKDDIINFFKILKEHFPKKALTNFHNNINSLKIDKNRKLKDCIGVYDSVDNTLEVKNKKNKDTLTHELLHMASRSINGICGFTLWGETDDDEYNIVEGIDEGYTELLNRRYFYPESESSEIYEYMVKIAECIEAVVGQELMQSAYLESDFGIVYDEVNKYTTPSKLTSFILSIDYIYRLFDKDPKILFDKKEIKNIFESINNFLLECYVNKLKQEKEYSNEEVEIFMNMLPTKFKDSNNKYKIQTDTSILFNDKENQL